MKDKIRYLCNGNEEFNIGKEIENQIKNSSVENELSYINKLIHAVMEIYKNESYLLDEFLGTTKVTDILNILCDIRLKIISYQQIEKDK